MIGQAWMKRPGEPLGWASVLVPHSGYLEQTFFRIFVSNVFSTYSLEKWIESHDSETLKRLWI